MLQNTVRLFWQTRHTFLVALAKIRDYETSKRKNSVGKFVSNPSTDKNRSTGQGKQIKMSILPVALNTVLLEKVNKLSKQTSVVADFRR